MKPMQHLKVPLLDLHHRHSGRISIRVSLDHYQAEQHEKLRGPKSWEPTIQGLGWLAENGFHIAVAGRMAWGEDEAGMRTGYSRLFAELGITLDAFDPARLVLFPEMDEAAEVPEISDACWGILGKTPDSVMCATSRMVAISNRLKIGAMAGMIGPYPTLGEINKRVAGSYYTPTLFSRRTRWLVRLLGCFG